MNWFIKLPVTLPELFLSRKDSIELPIGADGKGSGLIVREGREGVKILQRRRHLQRTTSVLFLFHFVPKIDLMCGIFAAEVAKFGRKFATNTIEFLRDIQQRGLHFLREMWHK